MPGGSAHKINSRELATSTGAFSDEQFEELVMLLRPIHDIAVHMLAEIKAVDAAAAPFEPAGTGE